MKDGKAPEKWTLRPIAGAIGVEVREVSLSRCLSESEVDGLRRLVAESGVVFLTGQQFDSDGHLTLARQLGTVKPPPEYLPKVNGYPDISVLSTENGFAMMADRWHADVTWAEAPPKYSILHMQEVPSVGGDTMWASQTAAYDRLSDRMKVLLTGLTAVHEISIGPRRSVHPVITRHPVTGRKALFVNPTFTTGIEELPPSESEAVLRFLFEHCVQPEVCCRWRWTAGDIAIWDNQFVQHYAINDYTEARKIHRVEIEGERPVPAEP